MEIRLENLTKVYKGTKADPNGCVAVNNLDILIPDGKKEIEEMASIVIFQLLAKDLALLLNRDVDKPRNLAKSVTVE